MKKILLLFLAISLLTGCENNPFAKKDTKEEKKDKDNDKDNDNDDDDDKGDSKRDNTDDDDAKGNWTSKQRTEWLNECVDEAGNTPQARDICACVLEKAEKKYPDVSDAENMTESEAERMARDCMSGIGGGGAGDEEADDDDDAAREDKGSGGGSWSNLQRKQFIQGCATTARQVQGFTAQQANDYCDCMTRKVERKHSFNEAAKMTSEDFNTSYWQNAAMNCRSNIE
ncbi:MAG: hypothetical protein JNK14_14155 [Chitinophagaceae bacterium]|nr:hypothetical protein [Chitinophagaceae bacterium]